jgi:Protein of unknown function (DUF3131)
MTRRGSWRKALLAMSLPCLCLAVHSKGWTQGPTPHGDDTTQQEPPEVKEPRVFSRGIIPAQEDEPLNSQEKESAPRIMAPAAKKNLRAISSATSEAPKSDPSAELQQQIAARAWKYFLANRSERTGMFNSVRGHHLATMWDVGSGIAGLVSAEKLQLLGRKEFLAECVQELDSLNRILLYGHALPNREYDIVTLTMMDYHSQPSLRGSGWSTTDLGRLLVWLKIAAQWYPELKPSIQQLVGKWKLRRIAQGGETFGAIYVQSHETLRQEGRLGYEQYSATGLNLWGVELGKALGYSRAIPFLLLDTPLQRDEKNGAFLTSEPFFLARLEIGPIAPEFTNLENAVYEVQQKRWEREGVLTAVSEDSFGVPPWFVYNTVDADGKPWACVTPSGREHPELKALSTKAAIAWWAIRGDSYSLRLLEGVKDLFDPDRGYYAGLLEEGGTNTSLNINTNAVILESMLYRRLGRRSFLQIPRSEFEPLASAETTSHERTNPLVDKN